MSKSPKPSPRAKAFLRWLESDEAKKLIELKTLLPGDYFTFGNRIRSAFRAGQDSVLLDDAAIERLARRIAKGLFTTGSGDVAYQLRSFNQHQEWLGCGWSQQPLADFIAARLKKAVLR